MEHRVCTLTGLGLIASPSTTFRITNNKYGPLKPKVRKPAHGREAWGRYDTVGQTVYTADSLVSAFLEVLSPYRTVRPDGDRALQSLAESVGIDLTDLWDQISDDWGRLGNMNALWLPAEWREERNITTLELPHGWWIDMTAAETIAALSDEFPTGFPDDKQEIAPSLSLSEITGDNRMLTTTLAGMLRDRVQFDDGSLPLGVRFHSKHGAPSGHSGHCWAHWLRPEGASLPKVKVLNTQTITVGHPALVSAAGLFKINVR